METFPDHPISVGSDPQTRARGITKHLGDGYIQTGAQPPVNLFLIYKIRFAARPTADIVEIDNFLAARGGHEAFLWRMPDEAVPRVWTCDKWTIERLSADLHTLTASLAEEL